MTYTSTLNIPNYVELYIVFCAKYGTGIFRTYADFVDYIARGTL